MLSDQLFVAKASYDRSDWGDKKRKTKMECFHMLKRKQESRTTTTTTTTKSMSVGSTSTTSMSGGDHDMRRSGSESHASEFSSSSAKSFAALSQRQSNNLREFSFSELKSATKNFSRSLMIGEGGFGGVYRAVIRSAEDHKKIDVAVKQLSKRGLQGHKEWVTEVNVLGVVVHHNLVKLLGYCAEDDERGIQRLLIYEYMPNRSVQDHLSNRAQTTLSWPTRMKIAQDAARGLTYLHEGMEFQIIFRDFKSSNILLDEQWNGKLSDFGLARLGPSDGLSHVSTAVVGTIGYAAPEYIQTGRLTSKSDVWSFGVFLYELITGRRPLDRNRPKNEQKMLDWVKPHLSDAKKFHMILDPRLEGKYSLNSAKKLASVANRCLIRQAKSRPKMSEILAMIDQIIDTAEAVVGSPQMPLPHQDEPQRSQFFTKLIDPLFGENGCLKTWKPTRSQEAV